MDRQIATPGHSEAASTQRGFSAILQVFDAAVLPMDPAATGRIQRSTLRARTARGLFLAELAFLIGTRIGYRPPPARILIADIATHRSRANQRTPLSSAMEWEQENADPQHQRPSA
jgi:hypothetical protein